MSSVGCFIYLYVGLDFDLCLFTNKAHKNTLGVHAAVQWDLSCLWSAGTQVQSQASYSGLRIWHCHIRSQLQLGYDPWPGNSISCGVAKKEKVLKNFYY